MRQHLWEAAAELCNTYSIARVSRRPKLSYAELRKRTSPGETVPQFIELNSVCLFSQWQLERERSDGAGLEFSGSGQAPDLEAVLLATGSTLTRAPLIFREQGFELESDGRIKANPKTPGNKPEHFVDKILNTPYKSKVELSGSDVEKGFSSFSFQSRKNQLLLLHFFCWIFLILTDFLKNRITSQFEQIDPLILPGNFPAACREEVFQFWILIPRWLRRGSLFKRK